MKGVRQHDERDCGIACIATICLKKGIKLPMFYIRNKAFLDKNGLSLFGMIEVLKELGFEADALKGSFFELEKELKNIQLPFIALVTNDNYENHYVVVEKINDKVIKIFDPAKGETKLTAQQFIEIWSGYIVIVSKSNTRDEKIQINGKKNKYFNIIKKTGHIFCVQWCSQYCSHY